MRRLAVLFAIPAALLLFSGGAMAHYPKPTPTPCPSASASPSVSPSPSASPTASPTPPVSPSTKPSATPRRPVPTPPVTATNTQPSDANPATVLGLLVGLTLICFGMLTRQKRGR